MVPTVSRGRIVFSNAAVLEEPYLLPENGTAPITAYWSALSDTYSRMWDSKNTSTALVLTSTVERAERLETGSWNRLDEVFILFRKTARRNLRSSSPRNRFLSTESPVWIADYIEYAAKKGELYGDIRIPYEVNELLKSIFERRGPHSESDDRD